ncbi:amidase [Vagococcus sp. BWB3-3]|uniref:Amidase n=1 Tax=Vagococcus allomyrinae TaxID=2794353 RepID=A0A940P8N5_9ENTE|nr:amidase [Vagococcus allomyrinae]MBP1039977.1 amidase [Vagococcus allomyrinae]
MKDATYWATEIREKRLSPHELITETERRVLELNPELNAVVELDKASALKELASRVDQEEAPFYGVPIALKMLGQHKAGMGDTSSSRLFVGQRAKETDHFVKGIERLGLIPFGKTNAPEFGFKNITDPQLYGVTKNAWNIDYHAGGSSGGAASALASGMFPIVGASDGGGSIRIPASFSGLIGLKPTRGSMPTGPHGWRGWQGASIDFALTVSMRDTIQLFDGLRGNHKAAPYQAPAYGGVRQNRPLRIAYCVDSPIKGHVTEAARQAFEKAASFLARGGHELVEVAYPVDGPALIDSYYAMNGAETVAMMDEIEAGIGRPITKEDVEPMTWAIYQYGKQISAGEYVHSLQLWDQAAYVMETLFETYDAFLSPTATDTAPKVSAELQSPAIREKLALAEELSQGELKDLVYEMFAKSLAVTPYTQLANLTGQPAISLPVYVAKNGLPLGIQLMASKSREDILFRLGRELEEGQQLIVPTFYRE